MLAGDTWLQEVEEGETALGKDPWTLFIDPAFRVSWAAGIFAQIYLVQLLYWPSLPRENQYIGILWRGIWHELYSHRASCLSLSSVLAPSYGFPKRPPFGSHSITRLELWLGDWHSHLSTGVKPALNPSTASLGNWPSDEHLQCLPQGSGFCSPPVVGAIVQKGWPPRRKILPHTWLQFLSSLHRVFCWLSKL